MGKNKFTVTAIKPATVTTVPLRKNLSILNKCIHQPGHFEPSLSLTGGGNTEEHF